jgi:hypothetical protein
VKAQPTLRNFRKVATLRYFRNIQTQRNLRNVATLRDLRNVATQWLEGCTVAIKARKVHRKRQTTNIEVEEKVYKKIKIKKGLKVRASCTHHGQL